MKWNVGRRLLLLGAFAVTVPLPLAYGLDAVATLARTSPVGSGDAEIEPFVASLGFLAMSCAAVGTVIVWRRPGNRVGILLLAGALMLTSVVAAWPWLVQIGPDLSGPLPTLLAWWSPIGILPAVFVLFPSVVLVFPDGQFPGRPWALAYRALVVALVGGMLLNTISPWPVDPLNGFFGNPFALDGVPPDLRLVGDTLMVVAVLGGLVLALASVVTRFRRATGAERAQVKWLAAAFAVNCVLFPLSYVTAVEPDELIDIASVLAASLIPVAIGIAVLRYHLYEIDRVISRTVSWAIVSGTVVATFVILVVGLQGALEHVTQGETLAVALSTLAVAALFQPVRRGVQRFVDRHFDRGRYDSQRTADAFAERLRYEVDLDALASDLEGTVHGAIRPAFATIWLPRREP